MCKYYRVLLNSAGQSTNTQVMAGKRKTFYFFNMFSTGVQAKNLSLYGV